MARRLRRSRPRPSRNPLRRILFPSLPDSGPFRGLNCRWSLIGFSYGNDPHAAPSASAGFPGRGAGRDAGRAGRPPRLRGPVHAAWPRTGSALHPAAGFLRTRGVLPVPEDPRRGRLTRSSTSSASPTSPPCSAMTCDSVGSWLTDVIELRYRLPLLWAGIVVRHHHTLAGPCHRPGHPRAHRRSRRVRRRAHRLVRQPRHPLPADPAHRPRPRPVHARPARGRGRRTPPTNGTSPSPPTRSPTTGPCTSKPTSTSPTPSASPKQSPPVQPVSPPSDQTTRSTAGRATALGDLARHQLAFGFDDDADQTAG